MTTKPRVARLRMWTSRLTPALLVLASTMAAGCAVGDKDLVRWETTLGGPHRLSAVILFDKYPHELRVKAAMSLITMKPRKGKSVGIERLVKGALVCDPEFLKPDEPCKKTELNPEARAKILAALVPLIIAELAKEPPAPTQKGQAVPDPSFSYKDAGFMMLSYEKMQLIADQALREQLSAALTAWAMADFERRLEDKNQEFGMEQMLRFIGSSSVVALPKLMDKNSRNLSKMSDLVAKIADKDTREAASTKLVEIVQHVSSAEWRKDRLPELKEANRKAGFDPTEAQLEKQLADFQNESVTRVYASMKQVGGSAIVAYCLDIAKDGKEDKARRQTALAALEGHIDRKNDKQIESLFEIAKSDAPAEVIDQAFRRIRELPRDKAIDKLYEFFSSKDWKLRRLAAATVLNMSTTAHVDEFLTQLGTKSKNFNLPEAITYGAYFAALKEGEIKQGDKLVTIKVLDALKPLMSSGAAVARMAAIGYYYERGNKRMLAEIEPFSRDQSGTPKCDEEAGCDWTCLVGAEGKKESKDIKTVGDFVSYCIKPKMEATEPDDAKKKPDGPKEERPPPGDKKDE